LPLRGILENLTALPLLAMLISKINPGLKPFYDNNYIARRVISERRIINGRNR